MKSNYESLDLGDPRRRGIEITRFLVEGRFNKGLRNVLKSGNAANFGDIKTQSFAVLFGSDSTRLWTSALDFGLS